MSYVLLGVFLLVALLVSLKQRESVYAVWQEEAGRLGLHFTGGGLARSRMSGTVRGYDVTVETFNDGDDRSTRIAVQGGRIPHSLELESEGRFAGVRKLLAGEDLHVGDAPFDSLVRVTGVESVALAVLSREMRRAVLGLVGSGGRMKGGRVLIERSGTVATPGAISRDVESLIALAETIPHGALPKLLQANAAVDLPEVRLRNLEALMLNFPSADETAAAAEAALADAQPAIRLLAATAVRGERGKGVLKALLGEKTITDALLARTVRTAAATGDPSFVEPILALVPRMDAGLAESVAAALGKLGDAKVESALLRLLGRPDLEVKRSAAAALGQVGTIRAVQPLLEEEGLAEIARDSVRRIQGRLIDAEAGRVSLAPQQGRAGALSIASEGGELSETPPAPGRVKS